MGILWGVPNLAEGPEGENDRGPCGERQAIITSHNRLLPFLNAYYMAGIPCWLRLGFWAYIFLGSKPGSVIHLLGNFGQAT